MRLSRRRFQCPTLLTRRIWGMVLATASGSDLGYIPLMEEPLPGEPAPPPWSAQEQRKARIDARAMGKGQLAAPMSVAQPKRRSRVTTLLVAVVVVGGLIILGSLSEENNGEPIPQNTTRATTSPTTTAIRPTTTTTLSEAEAPATTTTATTRAPAPARPSWCVHAEKIDAELALQERLIAQHGDQTADWPAGDLERFARSIDAQGEAAGRLWDQAPESHRWADVRRECRVNLPR